MRTLDAGTMGGDAGWSYRFVMFAVTLGGVFIISTLIGVLTSGVEGKLEELRKGRSVVVESDHTVILGWSSQIFTVVSELVEANASNRKACVAILADKDKVEMEDELRDKVGNTRSTRVVCRSGSPIDIADLEIVNPHAARSIIILSPETPDADSLTIKTILAITNNPNRREAPYHIVATVRNPKNMQAARLVGRDEAELVLVDDLVARVTAQTCRQSGLSVIYTELLDFGGDEMYFKEEPALVGKTFAQALMNFEDSALMGIYSEGKSALNPPMDTVFKPGDQVIVVSEDDSTVRLSGKSDYGVDSAAIRSGTTQASPPERTLILGWNRRAPKIIAELANYVAAGSNVTVLADLPAAEMEAACPCTQYENQSIKFLEGDATDRGTLEGLDVASYNHIITLGYSDTLEAQEADARTLITLLHLRDMGEKLGKDFAIVSEMIDPRNRELAEVTRADDFIVSDKLVSLMMAQISENKALAPVFEDLFDPEGSELYLKPAGNYVALGKPVNFYTVVESASRCNEVALGYKLAAQSKDSTKAYGVVVNPDKSNLITFAEQDRIVVLAEN
jgi:voltage-gated potassium channel Kch